MPDPGWRQSLARACAARAGLGPASLVLFDVSTPYFETDAGDGFREPGFSNYAAVPVMPRSWWLWRCSCCSVVSAGGGPHGIIGVVGLVLIVFRGS